MVHFVKSLRLKWLGLITRMEDGRMPKEILEVRLLEKEEGKDQ